MKRTGKLCLWLWIFGLLTGCAAAPNASDLPAARKGVYPETLGGTAVTGCSKILKEIWRCYPAGERFAVFGGDPGNSVPEGPGDIALTDTAMLQRRFFLTAELLEKVTEGAALEHLLNRNVFCTGVFRLAEGTDGVQFARQLGMTLEQTQWPGSRPQRYLIAQPEAGSLLLAYGQTRALETFLIRMNQAYPQGRILAYQEIPTKIPPRGLASGAASVSVQKGFESTYRF